MDFMCVGEFATKMTEAECVSTTIYESNHPINHLPLTPLLIKQTQSSLF